MEQITIIPVEKTEITILAQLANEIWHEYFPPIIGLEQVDYMVERFQSAAAIARAMEEDGYRYFFFCHEGTPIGYIGIQPQENSLFLSKLYLKKEYRGKKIARQGIDFLTALCQSEGFYTIRLTCNRGNKSALAAYQKMGFLILYAQDADIGNGFVMNDYVMEKTIDRSNLHERGTTPFLSAE